MSSSLQDEKDESQPRDTEAGDVESTTLNWALPKHHLKIELEQILRYRAAVGFDPARDAQLENADIPGIAISGGGIRSAVFSLGVLQCLAQRDKLKEIGYLSTVSGGSYLGAFYGSLFVPDDVRQGAPRVAADNYAEAARSAATRVDPNTKPKPKTSVTPIEYLRNNCNYLVPNGLDDVLQSIAFSARNWFALQYVIGVSVLAIILWLNWLEMLPWIKALLPANLPLPGLKSVANAESNGWTFPAVLGLATVILIISPLSRAYWLTQNLAQDLRSTFKALPAMTLALVAFLAVGAIGMAVSHHRMYPFEWTLSEKAVVGWASAIIVSQFLAFFCLRLAWMYTRRDRQTGKKWFRGAKSRIIRGSDSRPFVDRLRNALTNAYTTAPTFRSGTLLTGPFQLTLWFFALAIIDCGGSYLERWLTEHAAQTTSNNLATTALATTALATGGVWTLGRFLLAKSDAMEKAYKRIPKIILASVAAFTASVSTLLLWSTLAHIAVARVEQSYVPPLSVFGKYSDFAILSIICIVMLLIMIFDGLCIQFLNLSTYQRLYSTRLTRAFLGASNRTRLDNSDQRDVTSLVSGDSIAMGQYYDKAICAPVHLINATINKTVDWDSSLVHRGARGLSMCVGPAGIAVGATLGVLTCDWKSADDVSTPAVHELDAKETHGIWLESLTLGDWIAISGAAVSTGLGHMTRAGYSLLLGIANIRLGYWWDTYSAPFPDGALPFKRARVPLPHKDLPLSPLRDGLFGTQFCLLDELLGQFDGPRSRRWYLTDGGHFENTGVYELLRRKLKFIVLLDNGADAKFDFEDIATLMRVARVDFGIEVYTSDKEPFRHPNEFFINSTYVSFTFHDFVKNEASLAVRLLVRYSDTETGQIILVKPRLTTLAPHDVWEYRKKQADFPHETTANQFFNDVQWESHRALGESQARRLFGRP
jgi:hypothetical protein